MYELCRKYQNYKHSVVQYSSEASVCCMCQCQVKPPLWLLFVENLRFSDSLVVFLSVWFNLKSIKPIEHAIAKLAWDSAVVSIVWSNALWIYKYCMCLLVLFSSNYPPPPNPHHPPTHTCSHSHALEVQLVEDQLWTPLNKESETCKGLLVEWSVQSVSSVIH